MATPTLQHHILSPFLRQRGIFRGARGIHKCLVCERVLSSGSRKSPLRPLPLFDVLLSAMRPQPRLFSTTAPSTTTSNNKNHRDVVCAASTMGRRRYMEDEYIIQQEDDAVLTAVFDGHGGADVSAFLQKELYPTLLRVASVSSLTELKDRPVQDCVELLRTCLDQLDQTVIARKEWDSQGSTAVVAWLHRQPMSPSAHLIVANIGDSRAVLGQILETETDDGEAKRSVRAVQLTRDHKPDDPDEKHRIEEVHGGKVTYSIIDVPRVNGVLALSRSIGDGDDRPFVSAEPELTTIQIGNDSDKDAPKQEDEQGEVVQEFLLVATDGLWDTLTSQDAVKFVAAHEKRGTSRETIPTELAKASLVLGSYDNITVVVTWFAKQNE